MLNPKVKQDQSNKTWPSWTSTIRVLALVDKYQSAIEDDLFRIGRSRPLMMLMEAYCDKHSLDLNLVFFLFNGRRIHPTHTPDELMMEDGSTIDVLPVMVGPGTFASRNFSREQTQKGSDAVKEKEKKRWRVTNPNAKQEQHKKPCTHINLTVMSQQGQKTFMNEYCNKRSVDRYSVRFVFNGNYIQANLTPDELEMEDGDVIDVMIEASGGADV